MDSPCSSVSLQFSPSKEHIADGHARKHPHSPEPNRSGARPYLPDLTLWHKWHQGRGTLPEAWRGYSLAQVAEALGVSAWIVEHPWRVEHVGITVASEKVQGERIIRYETPAGTLTARWSLGPDGDWWQTEYPIKTVEDLAAAREVVAARKYVVESGESANQQISESGEWRTANASE